MSETQKLDFSAVNGTTQESFNQQKNLIKRMLKGNSAECSECKKPLTLQLPPNTKKAKPTDKAPGIYCAKGCTDIELDMEAVALLK
ncbi:MULTISPECIES: hypothetical protein [Shewanella]|uniref:hypothetical protein n=1 Tax=Shewanella TaxID=22 RepID=UPI0009710AB8|nr:MULTISPECIES: hypothetical protein [Shewanella]MDO6617683.1 hypothetical protein [Shewanella sp. 6_MG-2023]MDO6639150.1 hypothetical protein [Shewanella sp. 5_MG-2023]MDO6678391.1 hypothetical protein [Shewanella sp. 4_MG-2023]MDO6776281.1 hypothetical protein [Shewanella sp. 3_MG-2023]PMG42190.1 hypothetical protein BCU91_08735 [Shewanella sp. 10N.286.52.B9]